MAEDEQVEQLRVAMFHMGKLFDKAEVADALAKVEVDTIEAEQMHRVTWSLWDGESPVNDASAEYIKSRKDYVGGAVYLVSIDGRIVILQAHVPGVAGLVSMTEDEAKQHAETAREEIASTEISKAIAQAVWSELQ